MMSIVISIVCPLSRCAVMVTCRLYSCARSKRALVIWRRRRKKSQKSRIVRSSGNKIFRWSTLSLASSGVSFVFFWSLACAMIASRQNPRVLISRSMMLLMTSTVRVYLRLTAMLWSARLSSCKASWRLSVGCIKWYHTHYSLVKACNLAEKYNEYINPLAKNI